MSKIEYRIKEYNDTVTDSGVSKVVQQYQPQYKSNSFMNRLLTSLFGESWENLTEYPYTNLDKAKQVIKNAKLRDEVRQNRC